MNIPTKVLRSPYITYEAYFHHQQLAKKFYKSSKTKRMQEEAEIKASFKDELMKWFFSMSLPERIKAVSIENKWFSTMVQHMYTKYKYDQKIRFQLKFDDITPEELCFQQYLAPSQLVTANEINLENFFYFKNDRHTCDDRSINENLFLKELRYFSLREQNDTLTLSTSLLENEKLFKYFLDHFSAEKAFLQSCSVSLDNVLKVYNWDFPEWFNPREFNSISEFIIAYIEQVLSIRYWFALEERREKSSKIVPVISFSLCEEPNFNELFENREKLISFLKTQYSDCKDKLFSSSIDLRKMINDLKNDTVLMSKVKKSKPESMKNYFYLLSKTKFELFEPPVDFDHEIIEKIKKTFFEESEETFIDELIFCRIESINSLEDFLLKKIFEVLHNIYTEKNAIDLMNEESNIKKVCCDTTNTKSKRKKKRKVKSPENLKKEEISLKSSDSIQQKILENSSCEERKKETCAHSHQINIAENSTNDHVILNVIGFEKESRLEEKVSIKEPIKVENKKMSWRKMTPTENNKNLSKSEENTNNDEVYVNTLVKSLLNKIISIEGENSEDNSKDHPYGTKTLNSQTLNTNNMSKFAKNKNKKTKPSCLSTNTFDKGEKVKFVENKKQKNSKPAQDISRLGKDDMEENRNSNSSNSSNNTNNTNNTNSSNGQSSETDYVECKIETINHEIIQTPENKRKMVDNFSQTDKSRKCQLELENESSPKEEINEAVSPKNSKLNETLKDLNLLNEKPKKKKKIYQKSEKSPKNQEKENERIATHLPGLCLNAKPKIKQDGRIELKKCISDGYSFKEKNEKTIIEAPARNQSGSTNSTMYSSYKPSPPIKSSTSKKSVVSSESTNWDGEDYQEDEFFNSNSRTRYKYNSNYKKKFNPNWNGCYGNKFNSDGNYLTSKHINNRALFSRCDFNPSYGYPKEPPVYNNYYIFNSNVNINNVQNFDERNVEAISKPVTNHHKFPTNQPNMYFNYPIQDMHYVYPSMLFPGSQVASEESSKEILNRIPCEVHPFIFHYRLHNDILDYSNSVTEVIKKLKEVKLYIISYLESSIIRALDQEVAIDLYGSFATDLSIESSDIDITIKFPEDKGENEINGTIEKLCESFKNMEVFESVHPIITASVPVIKILIDPEKILDKESLKSFNAFKSSEIFKNYRFDHEELLKIKVDLTFIELTKLRQPCHSTKSSLDWAKRTLSFYPEIKPIIHVLKRYLQIKQLNSSFNGGLSSFSLFLLIVAYLKYPKIKTKINLGRILMEILELYGKFFQYAQSIIDVNLVSPFVFTNDFLENFPVILDPVTGMNVAKSSYRIEEVRECLSQAYDFLNRQKINYDKKDLPSTTNVVFDLMSKSNVSCNFK